MKRWFGYFVLGTICLGIGKHQSHGGFLEQLAFGAAGVCFYRGTPAGTPKDAD